MNDSDTRSEITHINPTLENAISHDIAANGNAIAVAPVDGWTKLKPPDHRRIQDLRKTFGTHHNPFIRHIVRRTRSYLENTIDPETHEPYLKAVKVELMGEKREDAIRLPDAAGKGRGIRYLRIPFCVISNRQLM